MNYEPLRQCVNCGQENQVSGHCRFCDEWQCNWCGFRLVAPILLNAINHICPKAPPSNAYPSNHHEAVDDGS